MYYHVKFLAFEAIPVLGSHFREPVAGASSSCPKMCKTKFKKGEMKGFALSEINLKLGDSKEIYSVLPCCTDEDEMLAGIMDDVDLEQDATDMVIDGWKKILLEEKRDIFFEGMYNQDVDSRKNGGERARAISEGEGVETMASGSKNEMERLLENLMDLKSNVEKGFKEMNQKLSDHSKRISKIEQLWKKNEETEEGEKEEEENQEKENELEEMEEENEEEKQEKRKKMLKRSPYDTRFRGKNKVVYEF